MRSRLFFRVALLLSLSVLLGLTLPATSGACSYLVDAEAINADIKSSNFVAEGRAANVLDEGPWLTVELVTTTIYKGTPVESVVVRESKSAAESPCEIGQAQEGDSYFIVGTENRGSVELADGLHPTAGDWGQVISEAITAEPAELSPAPPSLPGRNIPWWRESLAFIPYGVFVVPVVVIGLLTYAIGAHSARRVRG